MRLIDADEFVNYVRKHCKDSLADLWCELIRRQPTVFDLEKVTEQLEDYLFEKYCIEGDEKISEILKKGGIE